MRIIYKYEATIFILQDIMQSGIGCFILTLLLQFGN